MVSPGHCSVQVEPAPQFTPHASTWQVTLQVEPLHDTVLDSPVTITSHVAPSRQLTLAERPTVKSHVEATHSGLALSPATTSQVAPAVQFASQELPHVTAHDEDAQSRLQPAPLAPQLETFVQPQLIALVVAPAQVQDAPEQLHWSAVQGMGPSPPPHAATTDRHPQTPIQAMDFRKVTSIVARRTRRAGAFRPACTPVAPRDVDRRCARVCALRKRSTLRDAEFQGTLMAYGVHSIAP